MRALILSDTHGYPNKLLDALKTAGDCDMLVHLGDGRRDLLTVRPYLHADVVEVKGNNDFSSDNLPEYRIINICGQNVFCCHGHLFGVREGLEGLAAVATKNGCSVALFGHTHEVADTIVNGVRCLNPGSIGYPMGAKAVIEVTEGEQSANFNFIYL